MKTVRFKLSALLLGAILVSASCGEPSLTKPVAQPSAQAVNASPDLIGGLLQPIDGLAKNLGLLSCRPLPTAWAQQTVGPLGGVINIGPHSLVIPPGALSQQVTISAVAPSGNVNAVKFEPEGLQFAHPAYLTISYANCNVLGIILPKRIAYTDDNLNILSYLISVDNMLAQKVTGQVNHFSEYAGSW
jgi:hypothetical protein